MNCHCHHCRPRFCNMEAFEEAKRHDAHCKDECREHHDHHHCKGCEFEAKCHLNDKRVCVKVNPKKCCLNLEVERKCHDGNRKKD